MADRLADWVALVDACYPESSAQPWDATGLQVGDEDDGVAGVLVCLDVTPATIDEARDRGADLLVAHHPLLFRPLERLTGATAAGRLALRAARTGVAVLAAHTNFDAAVDGTTDPIVRLLGLRDARPLLPVDEPGPGGVKLVTFVPPESTDAVLAAVAAAGAGRIGAYDEVSFRVRGTGTFRPGPGAQPVVGEVGRRNEVAEDRLEVVVPRAAVAEVVAALVATHPYEEVAYDLVLVALPPAGGRGLGRVGELPTALPLRTVADRLAAGLPAPHLRVAGDLERPVRRVAACGGAGDSLVGAALAEAADVYVTGDLRHHVALDALTQGLALVDAGHGATEAAALPSLHATLAAAATARGLTARLLASAARSEPWAQYRPAGLDTEGAQ